jgi:hypothetical protein
MGQEWPEQRDCTLRRARERGPSADKGHNVKEAEQFIS